MRNNKAFTMVELMVVVLIVGILAAVAVPMMTGRIDSAKWSEAKSAMGTIASALRSYAAEQGSFANAPTLATIGIDQQRSGRHVFHARRLCHHVGLRQQQPGRLRDYLHGGQLHPGHQADHAGGDDPHVQRREQLRGHLGPAVTAGARDPA